MNISKNITSIREAKGIKQYQVAEMLGIEPPNYSRLEKRGNKLTLEQVEKIGEALGVSVFELLTGEQQTTRSDEKIKELEVYLDHWKELAETRNERLKMMSRHLEGYREILSENLWEIISIKIQDRYPEGFGVPLELAKIISNSTLSDMISMLSGDELRQVFRGVIWNDDVLCYAIREGLLGEEGKVFRQYQIEFEKERNEAYKKQMGLIKPQD